MREAVARAMMGKAASLEFAEGDRLYEAVVARYGDDARAGTREAVANAIAFRAEWRLDGGQFADALPILNEIVERYADAAEPHLRLRVAAAIYRKGMCFEGLGRRVDAQVAYGEVVRRFEQSTAPELQEHVAYAADRLEVLRRYGRRGRWRGRST